MMALDGCRSSTLDYSLSDPSRTSTSYRQILLHHCWLVSHWYCERLQDQEKYSSPDQINHGLLSRKRMCFILF